MLSISLFYLLFSFEIKFLLVLCCFCIYLGDIKSSEEIIPLHERQFHIENLRNCCSKTYALDLLRRRLPFLVWLPKYNVEDLKGDLIAGMTVALTVIPQGLAYALLAGLQPQVIMHAYIKNPCS